MIRWRQGVVRAARAPWPGVVEVDVVLEPAAEVVTALAYVEVVGEPVAGDRVLLNTTALAQGLGTGGYALVVALPDRLPADPSGPGHLVKARYTPMQTSVLGADEPDSPHHAVLRDATSVDGMPVVVADLHSALPAVLAGLRSERKDLTVSYVMTDGGALPLGFSKTVPALRAAGWLAGTVTTGQGFGGDLETVTLHTGLLAARHVQGADVAVVTQGPGNLGTGTPWGFSGVAVGEDVNAVAVLGGRPVGALRVSGSDPRERHRGISHHSMTALGRVAIAPCLIALPLLPGELGAAVRADAATLPDRHRQVEIEVDGLAEALAEAPVRLSTMGRGYDEDSGYFLAAAAAGRLAARLLA